MESCIIQSTVARLLNCTGESALLEEGGGGEERGGEGRGGGEEMKKGGPVKEASENIFHAGAMAMECCHGYLIGLKVKQRVLSFLVRFQRLPIIPEQPPLS